MILASTDCLVTAIVADSQTNLRNNSKKEIIAQGIAQTIIGFLGALGGGGTKGATLINLQSGGRRWSGVFSSIFFILLILFFGFLGKYLPIAVLAGVIIFVGFGMINFNLISWITYKKSRIDGIIALTVFAVTISVNLVTAVGIGILISMLMYFRMQIKAPIIHVVRDGVHKHSLNVRTDEEKNILHKNGSSIVMFELRGNIFFATADKLLELSEEYIKKDQYLIFNFLRVQFIDISGIILILQISSRMKKAGGELILCHMHNELGIGKKINKALEHIDKKNSIKIRTFVDTDSSFEYAENKILQKYSIDTKYKTTYIELKENALCKGIEAQSLSLIEKLSIKHKVKKDHILFNQGDMADSLFILLQGEVEIRLYTSKDEYKRLAKYNPGTFFGEISFISPGKRSASAIVNSNAAGIAFSLQEQFADAGLDS
jgi:SulP family sulfate permease